MAVLPKPWSDTMATWAPPGATVSAVARSVPTRASMRSRTAMVSAVNGPVTCWT